jgi:hypothetical protein
MPDVHVDPNEIPAILPPVKLMDHYPKPVWEDDQFWCEQHQSDDCTEAITAGMARARETGEPYVLQAGRHRYAQRLYLGGTPARRDDDD